jgi:hypothetical protein
VGSEQAGGLRREEIEDRRWEFGNRTDKARSERRNANLRGSALMKKMG